MKSETELFKIGFGPSSSHTMAPAKAAAVYKAKHPDCKYRVTLFGSLAKTGKGHLSDVTLKKVLGDETEVVFDTKTTVKQPVTMDFATLCDGVCANVERCYSVGGGDIQWADSKLKKTKEVYPFDSFAEIKKYYEDNNLRLWQFCEKFDNDNLKAYVLTVWQTMKNSIVQGLNASGILPGGLNVVRRAKLLFGAAKPDENAQTRENRLVSAYAFAVGEQNAGGGIVATAPTCGSAGVVPSVLFYMQQQRNLSDERIVEALLSAGVIGNLVKQNASISGAKCGCQAEIGTACAMAAAAVAELNEMTLSQIEYSAEISIEHHLGLTCDPICGLVQIPCIERNAVAAMRAINSASIAGFLADSRKVSLDTIIETMYFTGKDLDKDYRETALGGLAKHFK